MAQIAAESSASLPDALRGSPGFLLGKAAQIAAELVDQALRPRGLKVRHYGVLVMLQDFGPLSQHDLGQALRIDRTTMVAVVDHLERVGYVRRDVHPEDRRSYQIQATIAGAAALKTVRKAVIAADDTLVSGLSARQRAQLVDLLQHLAGLARGRS